MCTSIKLNRREYVYSYHIFLVMHVINSRNSKYAQLVEGEQLFHDGIVLLGQRGNS
jgi:hypothetical protein